jgi:hypothetical protein
MTWHVDDTLLTRWVDGSDGALTGASVEQHLLHCAECRARVPQPDDLGAIWANVRHTIEAPAPSWLERLLLRMKVSVPDARVIAKSPAFRAAWLSGLAVVLGFVVVAALWADSRGQWLFLLVAPLVPAAGVAIGYDPQTEPSREVESVTAYSGVRLVLLRSLVLIVTGLPLLLCASVLVAGGITFLWLVPAAALTVGVLAASTWVSPLEAAGVLGLCWAAVVGSAGRGARPEHLLAGGFLAAYTCLAVLAVLVLALRRAQLGEARGGAA